jgi:hypothetical protein
MVRQRLALMKELTSFVHEYGITDLVTSAVPPGTWP